MLATILLLCAALAAPAGTGPASTLGELEGEELAFGAFTARFAADGSFEIVAAGAGWPPLRGQWKTLANDRLELRQPTSTATEGPLAGCDQAGTYNAAVRDGRLELLLEEDPCRMRGMLLGASTWRPSGSEIEVPERRFAFERTATERPLPEARPADGSWPSFRGPAASGVAEDADLPVSWDVTAEDEARRRENVLWRVEVPGLAHSSPVVWGDRVFLTTAISSAGEATFRPGLYGDGDADPDRSQQRFELLAFDKRSGEPLWRQLAVEMAPREKRHIKSTYANPTPATDGRTVVAWFGSQGLYAFDVEGNLRWSLDHGHIDLGAYDVPSYEWGPASSPILWQGKVILQVDTQTDDFVMALDAASGELLWRTPRDELPTWGTPTVIEAPTGPELVTNGAHWIRGYDPRNGEELWRLGGSSKITAPTPIAAEGLIVVASGRAPERPIFAVRPGSRGDLTLEAGESSNEAIAWSHQRRGPYMPTPLAYRGLLYVLANNGVLDAYDLGTGEEVYRQRLQHGGSGYSASPVAAGGRIYLSGEDGQVLVVAAGREFEQLGVGEMGEPLMATPAISGDILFLRSQSHLTAIASRDEADVHASDDPPTAPPEHP
ncbi:MAG: hypothetical protein DWQ36_05450 [Acidobacteria bacterium]|nr:MAG: hypothetical protein DWQ30_17180 [Acidobacteriota bacterium]REK09721.1 MAG: hypothetical protein DWQ36_05450 [Acidobacteriota bacterium]